MKRGKYMEILFITPSIPNDFSRVRAKNLIKGLSKKHNVTLVSLYNKDSELEYLKDIEKYLVKAVVVKKSKLTSIGQALIGLFLPYPIRVTYMYSRKLKKILKEENKKNYDLIYIKRVRLAQYAKIFNRNKVYIDMTDSMTKWYDRLRKISKSYKKIICEEEYFKLQKYEKKIASQYNTIICSKEDKEYLEKKCKQTLANMIIIQNTIDTEEWTKNNIKVNKVNNRYNLVFSGMMDYESNINAVNFYMNNVHNKLSTNYQITFVGKNVPDDFKKYISNRSFFTGYVENMKLELQKYDIYICPLIDGAGIKNKILQAASIGLPIVTTPIGVEGMNPEINKYVFLANDSKEIVERINEINSMEEKELIDRLKEQRKFVINEYDISNQLILFEEKK